MPGTWMRFTRAGTDTERWWSLAHQREQDHEFDAWREEFLSLLDDATRIRLRADVPWGAFLSGGVDSSAVVAAMAEVSDGPVNTCSMAFDDPAYDESKFAQAVADRYHTHHAVETVASDDFDLVDALAGIYDEPYADSSAIPTYRVCQLARRHVTDLQANQLATPKACRVKQHGGQPQDARSQARVHRRLHRIRGREHPSDLIGRDDDRRLVWMAPRKPVWVGNEAGRLLALAIQAPVAHDALAVASHVGCQALM